MSEVRSSHKPQPPKTPITDKCVVCNRIPPKMVFSTVHKAFKCKIVTSSVSKEEVHVICREITELINYIDSTHRIFFCGRSATTLLAGVIWLYSFRNFETRMTQKDIASQFGVTEVTLRKNAKYWLKHYPDKFEFFTDYDKRLHAECVKIVNSDGRAL